MFVRPAGRSFSSCMLRALVDSGFVPFSLTRAPPPPPTTSTTTTTTIATLTCICLSVCLFVGCVILSLCVRPSQRKREAKVAQLANKDEQYAARAPICEDPARMQPILATLSQIEQDTKKTLVNERTERTRKIQRVRHVIASTNYLSHGSRKKSVERLTKSFKLRRRGGKRR